MEPIEGIPPIGFKGRYTSKDAYEKHGDNAKFYLFQCIAHWEGEAIIKNKTSGNIHQRGEGYIFIEVDYD